MRKFYFILLSLTLIGISSISGQEVRSITEGISIQLNGSFSNWRSNSLLIGDIADSDPNGRGIGVEIGYSVTPTIELFGNYNSGNYNLSREWDVLRTEFYSIGGRYYFGGSRQNFRPYLNVGGSRNNVKIASVFIRENNVIIYDNAEMILKGFSGNIGGGVMYFPIPELAINLGLEGRFGRFGSVTVDTENYNQNENIDFRFFALKIGAKYFFF